jgi:hypothetical protein
MVDASLLQSLSYLAAAIGVCIAAFYYAMNLRETTKNRRATLSMNILQSFMSEEGALRWVDLVSMQWDNFDDYVKKYDSSVNRENYAKRATFWNTCDMLGYQYRSGILDIKTIYNVGGPWILGAWRKFKPIIEEYRKWEWPRDTYKNFEYLANVISKMQEDNDAEWERKSDIMISTHVKPTGK